MSFEIKKITKTNKEITTTMVNWMYNWWGIKEGYTKEEVTCYIEHSFNDHQLPITYGMFKDNKIIGMYQFITNDLFIRPDIYPWLANVYIDEAYRGKGYGQELIKSIKKNARENLTSNQLYLFTKHIGLYEKYGWKFIEEVDVFKGEPRIRRLYKLDIKGKD